MAFLIDTHVLAWWLLIPDALSSTVMSLLETEEAVFVSAITAYEMAYKFRLGKWKAIEPITSQFEKIIESQGVESLAVTSNDALRAAMFSSDHRDPFDRMIAAQALERDYAVVTKDPVMDQFGIKTVW
ncbi:MAG: type II toxin-antitoxin system VapC family toxin [Pseudomonadota bacterium]